MEVLLIFVYLYADLQVIICEFQALQQTILLHYSFDNLIPEKHPVRVVDQIVESPNIQPLLKAYSKEGNPGYHPKMLLKVMLYAYMANEYSSRKIELALRENINFMWLTSMTILDHNTAN